MREAEAGGNVANPAMQANGVGSNTEKALQKQQRLPLGAERALLRLLLEARWRCDGSALLRRGRGEPFAFAARFRLGLGFGRLLDFFSAFIFASHG